MKRKLFSWRGTTPPVLAMIALMLTLGVVGTIPVAYAKYSTSASITASGAVAKWSVTNGNTKGTDGTVLDRDFYLDVDSTDHLGYFKITLDNEVACDITIVGVKDGGPVTIQTPSSAQKMSTTGLSQDYVFRFPPMVNTLVTFIVDVDVLLELLDPTDKGPGGFVWTEAQLKSNAVVITTLYYTAVQVD